MKKSFIDKIGCGMSIFWLVVVIGGGIGWVMNIIKFTQCDFEAPYKKEIVHAVGLVPVIGAFTGWMNIKDGAQPKVEPVKPANQ